MNGETGPRNVGAGGVVPIFATPFAAVDTGADSGCNARLASFCESQRSVAARPDDPPRDRLHFRSRSDLLDAEEAAAGELKRLILGQACAVVAGLDDVAAADFTKLEVQARGWCSIVQPEGHIGCQHFTGASWLAVYCVQAAQPRAGLHGAGVLRLYERRLGSIFRDASTAAMAAPYRYGNHTWTPAPGWMALFPAHLPHEVSVVRSATPLILVFAMLRFLDRR